MRWALSGHASTGWDCGTCMADEASEALRRARNCEGESNPNIAYPFDATLRRCPVAYYSGWARVMLDSWLEWRMFGETPWGPVMSAPQWYVDALRTCEAEARRIESERLKGAVNGA